MPFDPFTRREFFCALAAVAVVAAVPLPIGVEPEMVSVDWEAGSAGVIRFSNDALWYLTGPLKGRWMSSDLSMEIVVL